MKKLIQTMAVIAAVLMVHTIGYADESESFSTEKMVSDLNEKIELSKEQWEALKPVLGEKSEALKKSIEEYVEKGYLQMDEMSEKLKGVSETTEKKLEAFLNSEEMQKLKNYLSELDEDAIKEAKERLIAELSEALALTEEQLAQLKPVLDESMVKMTEMIETLAQKGKDGWEEFKQGYKSLTDDLKKKLEETLDNQQMDRFEEYKQEKQEKIQMALATA